MLFAGLLAAAACRTAAPPPVGVDSWSLAPADLGSQRLYRVEIRQESEAATLRLVLRLTEADRFELAASDSLGRSLGTLVVDDGRGVWRAARGRSDCRFDPDRPLAIDQLDWELPARDLVAALVGRLPEVPTDADLAAPVAEFLDRAGRRWTAVRDDRGPLRWTLWRGAEPALRWERTERGGVLSAARPAFEVRWRESAREPLGAASRGVTAAEVEGLAECDGAAVS